MHGWDEAFAELRADYVREVPSQLDELAQLIDHLGARPDDLAGIEELLRGFHSLNGSGRTYGLAGMSDIAREGEVICRAAVAVRRLTGEDLSRCHELVRSLRSELALSTSAAQVYPAALPSGSDHGEPSVDVLVLDDDRTIRQFLASLLSQHGYTVRTADRVASARQALEEKLPDVLVADVLLPDGTGFELIEYLRSLPGGDAASVIVVSVRTAFIDRVEAIHCGADAYFEKPVNWDALIVRVRQMVEASRSEPARVLSVEDDPQQAAFLRTVLESGGYEVRICSDPAHFETDLSSFRPELVLMDVVLPGMSGYDLVRYIRQEERHATLPVLMITSEGRAEARIQATRAGADDFLLKPVAHGLLLSAVAARIERARFLRGLIERDGLTHLLTHSAFVERARTAALRQRRQAGQPVAWVMLDIDHFKSVNDRYGHPAGDRTLTALADHLRRHLRRSDTLGRYGGEEFALLLEDLGEADAVRLVDRLRDEFAAVEHRAPDGSRYRVTFSAGIALLPPAADLDSWRAAADAALYEAKHAGRNCVAVARPSGGAFSQQPRVAWAAA
jgi:diguanylate cyclase (GGDEF)-like protein